MCVLLISVKKNILFTHGNLPGRKKVNVRKITGVHRRMSKLWVDSFMNVHVWEKPNTVFEQIKLNKSQSVCVLYLYLCTGGVVSSQNYKKKEKFKVMSWCGCVYMYTRNLKEAFETGLKSGNERKPRRRNTRLLIRAFHREANNL